MGYTPVTPFRRRMDAALMDHGRRLEGASPRPGVNKWEALRELAVARQRLGLSDRDMGVLQALVSFHPGTVLEGRDLVVHASNETICARLNGMPCSTMRRHLAHLVTAGVIARRDSPNGKRYARQTRAGKVAFGFDLTPLALRFDEFCALAEELRAEEDRLARQRETVSLMRRDLAGLAIWGAEVRPDLPLWTGLQDMAALTARALRRKLTPEDLALLEARLMQALTRARAVLEPVAEELSSNPVQNEQHHQNSQKDIHELEQRMESAEQVEVGALDSGESEGSPPAPPLPRLPLGLVLSSCPEIAAYADGPMRHWHQLVRAAEVVRPMMGISPDAWAAAKRQMGPEEASVVLAAILQRFEAIKSPGGYLRSLVRKATEGAFSSGPMVMALMRREVA